MSPSRAQSLFFGLLLAAFAALVALLLEPFLTYLLAGLLLAFAFHPLQRHLEPRVGARPAALGLVAAAVAVVVVPVVVMIATLPADATQLSEALERLTEDVPVEEQLQRLLGIEVSVDETIANVPQQVAEFVVGDISRVAELATHTFLGFTLLLFLLYYLLVDGDDLVAWTRERTPLPPEIQQELYDEAAATTRAVLEGHLLVAIIQGVVGGVGLFVVGIPNVVFWTVVMMFLELFPVVGVAGVFGPAILYLGATGELLAAGFLLVYGLTAVAVVDDYVRAFLVDRASSLHSAVILLGVFGGVYVFGVMGLFYGPIVIGLFQTLVRLFDQHYVAEG